MNWFEKNTFNSLLRDQEEIERAMYTLMDRGFQFSLARSASIMAITFSTISLAFQFSLARSALQIYG